MKFPMYMTNDQAKQLEYEVVSDELKIYLTRALVTKLKDDSYVDFELIRQNRVINKSRTLTGDKIYVLEADLDGHFEPSEYAWHNGEMELVFRRLSTPQFAEFLAELVTDEYFSKNEVNDLLERDGTSFRLVRKSGNIYIDVLSLTDIETSKSHEEAHPNIRTLVARMDSLLEGKDYAGVLHSSASIFETLAKIVVSRPSVQDKTLKSFFERYRKDSGLPEEVLNYILKVYEDRNMMPLAGHGSTVTPSITKEQAIVLAEMTKAFVKIEYKLGIEKE